MRFLITNIEKINNLRIKDDNIVISIIGPNSEKKIDNIPYRKDFIQLKFSDADVDIYRKEPGENEIVLFNREHARKILDFVDKYKNQVELIVVHCHAGMSRSPGVAAALSKILNGDDRYIVKGYPLYNRHVYKTILEEYYETM